MTATPATGAPLDALLTTVADRTPLAPVHAALHAELVAIEPGRCEARMPAGGGGVESVLVLADFVLGLAVTATLGAGERITTLRLAVQMLAAPAADGDLHGVGVLDHGGGGEAAGTGVGVSSAVITDAAGGTVARCSARNAVLSDEAGDTLGDATPGWPARPLSWAELVPVEDAGKTGLVARPDPRAVNTAAVVQGGVLAGIAARGLAAGLGAPLDDLTTTFVRAVPADGEPLTCRVKVEHTGRRLRSGRAELRDDRDRLLLTASGLAYATG